MTLSIKQIKQKTQKNKKTSLFKRIGRKYRLLQLNNEQSNDHKPQANNA